MVKRVLSASGKALQDALNELNDNRVAKVGWFERSKYDNKYATQVATVAAIQEFGAPERSIPPRPFIRPTIVKQQQAWASLIKRGASEVLKGNATADIVLKDIGLKAAGDIREAITQVFTPALKPETIKARLNRKSDKKTVGLLTKPLIDTGIMLSTLTNTVENE